MKLTVAERIAIVITLVLLAFVAGFFAGRTTVSGSVVVEAAVPENSAYIQPSPEVSEKASPIASPEVTKPLETIEKEESAASSVTEVQIWTPDSGELLDINLATQAELENLPDIGPVLAEKIIEYRNSVGIFNSIEEIKNVDGIGDKTYNTISVYIKVDDLDENSGS